MSDPVSKSGLVNALLHLYVVALALRYTTSLTKAVYHH